MSQVVLGSFTCIISMPYTLELDSVLHFIDEETDVENSSNLSKVILTVSFRVSTDPALANGVKSWAHV